MRKEVQLEAGWKELLSDEFDKPYFVELTDFVKSEYANKKVFPPPKLIFNALNSCPFGTVKVVILGQDPYHGTGQAHGLSFSVPDEVTTPPSLKNIYKEIENDIGGSAPTTGNLEHWAKQGVLLLNATLTVRARQPGSHQSKGWEEFTDSIIGVLNEKSENVVFLLWGNYAKRKGELVDRGRHFVLEAAHPSPYSASNGFFGCKHFSKANAYLEEHKKRPITWFS